jgi:hypothetical protein
VTGADVDDRLLDAARELVTEEPLGNVVVYPTRTVLSDPTAPATAKRS